MQKQTDIERCQPSGVPPLTKEQEAAVLALSKGETLAYNEDETFIDLFLRQAAARPDAPAVADDTRQLTYGGLDRRSDVLAGRLLSLGVRPGDFVGVMLGRTVDFAVCVLAVQKAGAAYVPLDAEYPMDRIGYMLSDSGAGVLLTTQAVYAGKCRETPLACAHIVFVDGVDYAVEAPPIHLAVPGRLAYMIYTSGSTGKPKGVMVVHKSLAAFIRWRVVKMGISESSRHALHSNFSFDASLDDLLCPLAAGGRVFIMGEACRRDVSLMRDYFTAHAITATTLNTQVGMLLLNTCPDLSLDTLVLGGDRLLPTAKTSVRLINGYGPTEFTVCAAWHVVDQGSDGDIPIGRPVPNSYAFVCDRALRLVPPGVAGELCLAGNQMAAGYWNNPELTAEKFVDCPFLPGRKMYRTGDLARYNGDGNLEFLGRPDHQVKLSGYRIELGEIECVASRFVGVKQAVAEVRAVQGVRQLCLYYTADAATDERALREHLARTLAPYMLPSHYVRLAAIPVLPNGKTDRKALPMPEPAAADIVAPAGEAERRLYDIVAETLEHRRFGVTSNLISAGMSSLAAMCVSVAVLRRMKENLPVKIILSAPTVRAWAEYLQTAGGTAGAREVKPGAKRAYYPACENQRGLYADWERHRDTTQYNNPFVKFLGAADTGALRRALVRVVDAHPHLKTRFAFVDGELVQLRRDEEPVAVAVATLTERPSETFFQSRVRPFHLLGGGLYRFEIYDTPVGVYLFCDIHHTIFDGSSRVVFDKSLRAALQGGSLPPETYTAFDRADYEREWLQSEAYADADRYFTSLCAAGRAAVCPYSTRPDSGTAGAATVSVRLSVPGIDGFCRRHGLTRSTCFLTALAGLLHSATGEGSLVFAFVDSGRDMAAMQDITGMFVKALPVASTAGRDARPFADAARAIQAQCLETVSHGIYPFAKVMEKLGRKPEVTFVYQGGLDLLPALPEEDMRLTQDTVKVPLTFFVLPDGADGYVVNVEYDTGLYNREDAQALLDRYAAFVRDAAGGTD